MDNDESLTVKIFIVHHSSFIIIQNIHRSSFIVHHYSKYSSFIIHRSSLNPHFRSFHQVRLQYFLETFVDVALD